MSHSFKDQIRSGTQGITIYQQNQEQTFWQTVMYVLVCIQWYVCNGMYVLVCMYWYVCIGMYALVCMYWYVCIGMYVLVCMYSYVWLYV